MKCSWMAGAGSSAKDAYNVIGKPQVLQSSVRIWVLVWRLGMLFFALSHSWYGSILVCRGTHKLESQVVIESFAHPNQHVLHQTPAYLY